MPKTKKSIGVFTIHRLQANGKFVPLERNKNYRGKLFKFVVPHREFATIRKELNMFNANASLFSARSGWALFLLERSLH